eukprot:gb/GECG01003817.1/.p1 GENE.gb/GECG01003817.1/~~gb/GECG01003817.1/.p1  ORF type:complete len:510 (+),score=86.00 gb/GECG01003817.1/:1-1530(+)
MAAASDETPFLRMPSSASEHVDTFKEEEVELCNESNALTYCIQGGSVKEDFDPIPDFALANETFPVGSNPNELGLPRLADPPRLEETQASIAEEPKEDKESVKAVGAPSPVIRKMTKALPDGVASANRFFSDKEWADRIKMVQQQMKKDDLDLIIVTSPANIFWMSGFHTTGYYFFQCMVVSATEEPFAMVRNMEGTGVQARTCLEHCYVFDDTEDPIATLVELIDKKVGTKKVIGYEEDSYFFPAKQQRQFTKAIKGVKFEDCSGLVEKCRRSKSPAEIEVMKLAGKATEAAMDAGMKSIAVGKTENDVAAEVYRAAYAAGGEYPACPSFIASGPRGYIGHATWEGRELREGDTVFLEIGGCKYRYHTAMMRTAYIGWEVPTKLKEMEKIFDRCLTECMKAMKPGVPIKDIDKLSKDIINNNNYGICTKNRFGYSLGVAFSPGWGEEGVLSLQGDNEELLEENMCFHLIPFVMLDEGTIGISETVRVTPDGAVSFYNCPREIRLIKPE